MSMAARFPGIDKVRRESLHRKNDSDEIDVFEAERYFSSVSENLGRLGSQKMSLNTKEDHASTRHNWRQGRVSLDMPILRNNHTVHPQTQSTSLDTIKHINDKKKHKQPSSPGGKLASFFNSLISQTVSKKKKSQSLKDAILDDESPTSGWRRRRRSSISHCRSSGISTTTRTAKTAYSDVETKSIQSCSSLSGFCTPPPYSLNSTTNPYKEFRNYSDHKQVLATLSKCKTTEINGGSSKSNLVNGSSEKRNQPEFKRFVEEDDGAESDSSSDLFELQLNYDHHHHKLGCCASGLPVYESTRMDGIKISTGTPITSGPFR